MIFAVLALRDIISLLLILLPLVCWLIAEKRGNRITRVSLGLLCMLVLCGGIYVSITASREMLSMHHVVLDQIDRALQEGDSSHARHAIETYRQTYKTTHSFNSAVWTTHWELARQKSP